MSTPLVGFGESVIRLAEAVGLPSDNLPAGFTVLAFECGDGPRVEIREATEVEGANHAA